MLRVRQLALLAIAFQVNACDGDIRLLDEGSLDANADSSTDGSGVDASSETRDAKPPYSCRNDFECKLPTLHCYVAAGICVPCLEDKHCFDGGRFGRCDTAAHRCVECGVSSDCGDPDETCEPTTHKCVHKCGFCPFLTKCVPERGICVSCTKSSECTDDDRHTCEIASGRCVQCITDAQCTSGGEPHCDPIINRCEKCVSAADCPSDKPFCDPFRRDCIGY